jgi:hypothetical protein
MNVRVTSPRVPSKTLSKLILLCVAEPESHVRFRVERESRAILELLALLTQARSACSSRGG